MGTRGLNVIVSDGKVRVALYNQWDSYPGGQGLTVLNFLSNNLSEDFVRKVNACTWISEDELNNLWIECGASPESDSVSVEVSKRFAAKYPWLSRDCGADIFGHINASENGLATRDSLDFAADSLFCEWCYVVDLDKNVFEVYKGFNQFELDESERFHFLNVKCKKEYYPVRLAASFSLNELPSDADFVKAFNEAEDD